jgi:hypothetical protein
MVEIEVRLKKGWAVKTETRLVKEKEDNEVNTIHYGKRKLREEGTNQWKQFAVVPRTIYQIRRARGESVISAARNWTR